MCPDKELLSAFFDGEVENPWQSELEVHLKECEHCREIIASFRSLHLVLQEDRQPDCKPAQLRTLERIQHGSQIIQLEKSSFWKKRLQVPLPMVAAAACLLILFTSTFTFFLGKSSATSNRQIAVADSTPRISESIDTEPPLLIGLHDDDLETIIRLIEDRNYSNEVIIRLPEDSSFSMAGEPKFIRAKDLNGSN